MAQEYSPLIALLENGSQREVSVNMMGNETPKITIVCPSYNHSKFVATFIKSVQSQTLQDFELIIVDDSSSDNNLKEINQVRDERILVIKHDFNEGISSALIDAISHARSDYCVFMGSDDVMEPGHLECSYNYLENNHEVDVFYSSLSLIDDDGNSLPDKKREYVRGNSDRFGLLRSMFFDGNQLLSPGMVVRTQAFKAIMPLDADVLQYQDYQIHVRLLINGGVFQSTEKLVKYRQRSSGANVSARSKSVLIRESLEVPSLMDSFLKIEDVGLLLNVFQEDARRFGEPTNCTIPYVLGRLAIATPDFSKQCWGYRTIGRFIRKKENRALLHSLYGFNFASFIRLVDSINDSEVMMQTSITKKYKKYKKLACLLFSFSIVLLVLLAFCIF
ncbi:MAG: glycosyltransferase [Pirellulales bacterium]|nr:glycosyltransferase [Pirellulales bacterium]